MLAMKVASSAVKPAFCNARYLHTRMNHQIKHSIVSEVWMVEAILGYILPPLDEELCIKIKENVQILKLTIRIFSLLNNSLWPKILNV